MPQRSYADPKSVGLFQMKRSVISSPRFHLSNHFLETSSQLSGLFMPRTCHKLQVSEKTMLTPEQSCRSSWIGTDVLQCRRLSCKCLVAPPKVHILFGECWTQSALYHVSQQYVFCRRAAIGTNYNAISVVFVVADCLN